MAGGGSEGCWRGIEASRGKWNQRARGRAISLVGWVSVKVVRGDYGEWSISLVGKPLRG